MSDDGQSDASFYVCEVTVETPFITSIFYNRRIFVDYKNLIKLGFFQFM